MHSPPSSLSEGRRLYALMASATLGYTVTASTSTVAKTVSKCMRAPVTAHLTRDHTIDGTRIEPGPRRKLDHAGGDPLT